MVWDLRELEKQSMYHFVEFMRIAKNPGKLPLSRYLKNSSGSCPGGLWNKNVIGVRFLKLVTGGNEKAYNLVEKSKNESRCGGYEAKTSN